MISSIRKLALTIHISVSVGWIGAVLAYLVLVVAAMTGSDLKLRAAWIAMELIGWYLLVPFAFATLVTGLMMAGHTVGGLFRQSRGRPQLISLRVRHDCCVEIRRAHSTIGCESRCIPALRTKHRKENCS